MANFGDSSPCSELLEFEQKNDRMVMAGEAGTSPAIIALNDRRPVAAIDSSVANRPVS
jgi:hypothetical protein